jgi:hypothetical protein
MTRKQRKESTIIFLVNGYNVGRISTQSERKNSEPDESYANPVLREDVHIPEVLKLWGALPRAARVVCMRNIFILDGIWTQDKIYILVATLLG